MHVIKPVTLIEKSYPATVNVIKFVIKWSGRTWMGPLELNQLPEDEDKDLRIRQKKGKVFVVCYYLTALQVLVQAAFVSFGFYQKLHHGHISSETAFHFVKIMVFDSGVMVMGAVVFGQSDIVALFNAAVSIEKQIKREGVQIKHWWETPASTLPILSVGFLGFVIPILFFLGQLFFPRNPMYMSSLLPVTHQKNIWILLGLAVYELYLLLINFANFMIIMGSVWAYFMNILIWFPVLRSFDPKSSLTFRKKFFIFQQMSILTLFFNGYIYSVLSIMIFGVSGMATITLYMSLVAYSILPIHIYLLFPVVSAIIAFIIFVTFSEIGQIREISKTIVSHWKCHVNVEKSMRLQEIGGSSDCDSMSIARSGHLRSVYQPEVVDQPQQQGERSRREIIRQQYVELEQIRRGLHSFGVKIVTIYCTIRTPQRMVEQILNGLMLMLQIKIKIVS